MGHVSSVTQMTQLVSPSHPESCRPDGCRPVGLSATLRNADEGSVSVVQPRQNERRYQRLEYGSRNRPANASKLAQHGETGRDGLRDV